MIKLKKTLLTTLLLSFIAAFSALGTIVVTEPFDYNVGEQKNLVNPIPKRPLS